jgi:hypothetical protein
MALIKGLNKFTCSVTIVVHFKSDSDPAKWGTYVTEKFINALKQEKHRIYCDIQVLLL